MRLRVTEIGTSHRRLIAVAMTCVGVSASAQEGTLGLGGVRGVVRDSMGLAIIGTQITMSGSQLVVETDDSGRFELAKVKPGMLSMRFRRLGYQPDTVELLVLAGKTVPVEVTLSRLMVSLTPIVITGRTDLKGWREGFYHRKKAGSGHFFTAADIEKRKPSQMTDMFRQIPSVRINPTRGIIRNQLRFRNAVCPPLTILDGAPLAAGEFDIDGLSPFSIAAFEVYTGSTVPPQFSVVTKRFCGAIVIWSKQGERHAKRTAPNAASSASVIASLVEKRQLFTAAQVDITARQDSAYPVRPMYPDELYDAAVSGSVMVEFIVNTMGEVDKDRISIVYATHPDFAEAVRQALEEARYVPAFRGGFPVHQLVQHEFQFQPEAGRRRK
jgi:TonB family protein